MSFYPRTYVTAEQSSLPPILRLLDEFDQYSRSTDRPARSQSKTFTPKFDIKELKESYELYGELPGIDQKDVDIEFTDASTLTVRGRTDCNYSHGTSHNQPKIPHKATVEDEDSSEPSTSVTTQPSQEPRKEPLEKFWVTERNVGEFSRSFSFPDRVDQDAVKASMMNGILSIIVPKAKKLEGRRITIQ